MGTEKIRALLDAVGKYQTNPSAFVEAAYDNLLEQLYFEEGSNWLKVNSKPDYHALPFNADDCLTLSLDKDGWVIPIIPELESGKWYEHDTFNPDPSSPAAFVDPSTMVEVFTTKSGVEDYPVAIGDVVWSITKRYRKYEPLDEAVTDFGIF